jgi:hypothetical protein
MTIYPESSAFGGQEALWNIYDGQGGESGSGSAGGVNSSSTEEGFIDIGVSPAETLGNATRAAEELGPVAVAEAASAKEELPLAVPTGWGSDQKRSLLDTPFKRRLAGIGAAITALAVLVSGIATAGDRKDGTPAVVAASAPGNEATPDTAVYTEITPSANPEEHTRANGYAPVTVESNVDPTPGNVIFPRDYPELEPMQVSWNGKTIDLLPVMRPDYYSSKGPKLEIQDTANLVMAKIAYLLSTPPDNLDFGRVLNSLTTDDHVKGLIREQANELQSKYGPDVDFVFFSTPDSKANAHMGFNSAQQPIITMNSPEGLYIRAIRRDQELGIFSNPITYAPGDAGSIYTFAFAYRAPELPDNPENPNSPKHAQVQLTGYTLQMTAGKNDPNAFLNRWFPISVSTQNTSPRA